jgi:hypothetical protein
MMGVESFADKGQARAAFYAINIHPHSREGQVVG